MAANSMSIQSHTRVGGGQDPLSPTVTIPIQGTTFEVSFTAMSTTLNHEAVTLLDHIIDETSINTLNLMGFSPPRVQVESQTKLLSQRLDDTTGKLTVQISRTLYVTVHSIDGFGSYNARLVPDKSVIDVATLSAFTNPKQKVGLVSTLRTNMPQLFGTLNVVAFDNFVTQSAFVVEENPLVVSTTGDDDAVISWDGQKEEEDHGIEEEATPVENAGEKLLGLTRPVAEEVEDGIEEDKREQQQQQPDWFGSLRMGDIPDPPTSEPTTARPSFIPTSTPTARPSRSPTTKPSDSPTTPSPTRYPTAKPSKSPTTDAPTASPSKKPTGEAHHTVPVKGNTIDLEFKGMFGELDVNSIQVLTETLDRMVVENLDSLMPNFSLVSEVNFMGQVLRQTFKVEGAEYNDDEDMVGVDSVIEGEIVDDNVEGSTLSPTEYTSSRTEMPGPQIGTLKVRMSRTAYIVVPESYDMSLLPTPSTLDVATLSIFARPAQQRVLGTILRFSEDTETFRELEEVDILSLVYDDSPFPDTDLQGEETNEEVLETVGSSEIPEEQQGEIWEHPKGNPLAGDMAQEGIGEIWELPPGTVVGVDETAGGTSVETVAHDCDTKDFLSKGGQEMELGYDYDLLYRPGLANIEEDIIEIDEMVARYVQGRLDLSCGRVGIEFEAESTQLQQSEPTDVATLSEEKEPTSEPAEHAAEEPEPSNKEKNEKKKKNDRRLGALPSESVSMFGYGEDGGIYWVDRGYLDLQDRAGICTSREGKTAAAFDLACVPMKGLVKVYYQASADPTEVADKVLESIQTASYETKSKSWAVYVGNRPVEDTSGIVAGATGSWVDKEVAGVTVKSILIWSIVAVFAALNIIVLGVLIHHCKRRTRIKRETKQYEEFQHKRKARKRARKVAKENKEFAEQHKEEDNKFKEEIADEIGFEAEPVIAATVVHSMVSDLTFHEGRGMTGPDGESAPVLYDRQEAMVLDRTGTESTQGSHTSGYINVLKR